MRIHIPRFIRRAFYRSRVARLAHEVHMLNAERESHGKRLDAALRHLRNAREDLFFVDVNRPPITRAEGRPRGMTTGTVRATGQVPPHPMPLPRRDSTMSDALAQREKARPVQLGATRVSRAARRVKVAGEAS